MAQQKTHAPTKIWILSLEDPLSQEPNILDTIEGGLMPSVMKMLFQMNLAIWQLRKGFHIFSLALQKQFLVLSCHLLLATLSLVRIIPFFR